LLKKVGYPLRELKLKPWKGVRDAVHEGVDGFGLEKKLGLGPETEKSVEDKHGLMNETCMLPLLKIVTAGMRY
jgi:hypothetical protein